jgi:hypothetical protein
MQSLMLWLIFRSFRKRVKCLNQEAPLGKSGSYFTGPLHLLSRRLDDVPAKYINFVPYST